MQVALKRSMVLTTLKTTVLLVILTLALLLNLVGLTVREMSAPVTPYNVGAHGSRIPNGVMGWYCPPPPRNC